jgi:CubicO group peptidase (beta-lactamase class C family)
VTAAAGWDLEALDAAAALARAGHSTDLVVRHRGAVVVDRAWEPAEAAAPVVVERLADGRVRQDVASAQKSITAVLVGIAVSRGLVQRGDRVVDHLGPGWTAGKATEAEDRVTVDHLLTMTSGLADDLSVVAPPGEWWDYNLGAAYHLLKRVLTAVTGLAIDALLQDWLAGPLALADTRFEPRRWDDRIPAVFRASFEYPDGAPIEGLVTTARDLATFGQAVLDELAGGRGLAVDPTFLRDMVRPSQALNPSYGLLWWLNGQPWFLAPKVREPLTGPFFPGVPDDAIAALGANDRCCVVIPSLGLVVARAGAAAGERSAAGSAFVRDLLARLVAAAPQEDRP